ncbi:MAG: CPBP family intramembrane glutamic endopeptidase [Natronomonas sp.]
MTQWTLFGGVTFVVLFLVVFLARASATVLEQASSAVEQTDPESQNSAIERNEEDDTRLDPADHPPEVEVDDQVDNVETEVESHPSHRDDRPAVTRNGSLTDLSTRALHANVAVSHGLFATILLAAIYFGEVPSAPLGVTAEGLSTGWMAVGTGIAFGVVLALANTMAVGLARAFGADPSERLRELLTPDSLMGWAMLLVVVLPVIAVFEELLFRAALIGGFAAWLDVSSWVLVLLSSVVFGLGHVTQGRLGVVVTGVLGIALGAAFVLTNSLLVVIVAHYMINVIEFVVGEGLEWKPFTASSTHD